MDLLLPALLAAAALWQLRRFDQGRRILLLGRQLAPFQIEKHIETLTQGFLRAMGEADLQRREQIMGLLRPTELALEQQFRRFSEQIAQAPAEQTRVSRLPLDLPFAGRLLPALSFDLRELLAVHARGIALAVAGQGFASERDRAYTLSAELLLMQHSCHWFCRSLATASARLMARNQTSHAQVLGAVSRETRDAYTRLTGLKAAGRAGG